MFHPTRITDVLYSVRRELRARLVLWIHRLRHRVGAGTHPR